MKCLTVFGGADDPQLAEFLQVMQPRSKSAIWANDATVQPPQKRPLPQGPTKPGSKRAKQAKAGDQSSQSESDNDAAEDDDSLQDDQSHDSLLAEADAGAQGLMHVCSNTLESRVSGPVKQHLSDSYAEVSDRSGTSATCLVPPVC